MRSSSASRPSLQCTARRPWPLRVCECLPGVEQRMQLAIVRGGQPRLADDRPWGQGLDERALATVLREVLAGVAYLHGRGIVHRDIKVPPPFHPSQSKRKKV